MTNTNDFRQYSYYTDPAYLISGFDVSRGSHAPKINPNVETKSRFTVRENVKVKSKAELQTEEIAARKSMRRIIGVAVLCLVLVAGVITSMAVKNEYTRQLASQEIMISNAQSEGVSLQSKLDAMVSISMIDDYAVNELGMTKVKSNQIQYMDVDEFKDSYQTQASAEQQSNK